MKKIFKDWMKEHYPLAECSYSGGDKTMYIKGLQDDFEGIVGLYIKQEAKKLGTPFKIEIQ